QNQQVEGSAYKIGSFFSHTALLSEYDRSRLKVPKDFRSTEAGGTRGNTQSAREPGANSGVDCLRAAHPKSAPRSGQAGARFVVNPLASRNQAIDPAHAVALN